MADYKRSISSDMLLAYFRQGVGKEMARCSHTPACCLSKLRSSLEAGKKQLRVWLQYANRVAEVLLYSSFGVPLAVLWFIFGDLRTTRSRFFVVRNDKLKCKKDMGLFLVSLVERTMNRILYEQMLLS